LSGVVNNDRKSLALTSGNKTSNAVRSDFNTLNLYLTALSRQWNRYGGTYADDSEALLLLRPLRLTQPHWKNPSAARGLCSAAQSLHDRSILGNGRAGCDVVDTNIICYRCMASPYLEAADAA